MISILLYCKVLQRGGTFKIKLLKIFILIFEISSPGKLDDKKKDYYEHKFNAAKRDIKRTWRIINNIINTKNRKVENTVEKIIHDDVVHVNSGDIANMFNDYFDDIGRNIAESIGGNNANHLDYMTHINQPNSFFFTPIHCYSTEKLICSPKNKYSNLNTIPVKILKSICDIISPCLTNIINIYINVPHHGVFPDRLKKARATSIPKEGDKSNSSNYRPISALPVFSKVFETVAYTLLDDYVGNNSILHKKHGFRTKKSTAQAILHFLQYLYKHIDSGNVVFSLFLDFRKAFDCVNHEILLSKLNTCGVRRIALDWFRSYLTNKEQCVSINNVDSNPIVIQCGVPQGSILGTDKTKYMLVSYNKNVNFPDLSEGNNTINETSITKFLGIHLDRKLNFVNLITEMSIKVAKSIGLLYKLNRFLPETFLKKLYTSLIHPNLLYGIEAWHGTYQNNTSKIFLLYGRKPYVQ